MTHSDIASPIKVSTAPALHARSSASLTARIHALVSCSIRENDKSIGRAALIVRGKSSRLASSSTWFTQGRGKSSAVGVAASSTVHFTAFPGCTKELGNKLAAIVGSLQDAPGCLTYSLLRDTQDTHGWIVRGEWTSGSEMQAHFNLPATQLLTGLIGSYLVNRVQFDSEIYNEVDPLNHNLC